VYPFYIEYFSLTMAFERPKHFVINDYILSLITDYLRNNNVVAQRDVYRQSRRSLVNADDRHCDKPVETT